MKRDGVCFYSSIPQYMRRQSARLLIIHDHIDAYCHESIFSTLCDIYLYIVKPYLSIHPELVSARYTFLENAIRIILLTHGSQEFQPVSAVSGVRILRCAAVVGIFIRVIDAPLSGERFHSLQKFVSGLVHNCIILCGAPHHVNMHDSDRLFGVDAH